MSEMFKIPQCGFIYLVHMKIADIILCIWTDFPPPHSSPPSLISFVTLFYRLSSSSYPGSMGAFSPSWNAERALLQLSHLGQSSSCFPKTKAACSLRSISCDVLVGEDQPASRCGMSTANCSTVIGHPFSFSVHFVFLSFLPKEQACGGDNLNCHGETDTLNLTAAQAQK